MYRDRGKFIPHAGCPTPKTCKMNGACMAPSRCHGAKKGFAKKGTAAQGYMSRRNKKGGSRY